MATELETNLIKLRVLRQLLGEYVEVTDPCGGSAAGWLIGIDVHGFEDDRGHWDLILDWGFAVPLTPNTEVKAVGRG